MTKVTSGVREAFKGKLWSLKVGLGGNLVWGLGRCFMKLGVNVNEFRLRRSRLPQPCCWRAVVHKLCGELWGEWEWGFGAVHNNNHC